MVESEYMVFVEVQNTGRKTRFWNVNTRRLGDRLGDISWWGAWRQYTFQPERGTIFNQKCLHEIAEFCKAATASTARPADTRRRDG